MQQMGGLIERHNKMPQIPCLYENINAEFAAIHF